MIRNWLMRSMGTAELLDRIIALEREVAASQAMVAMLASRVATSERTALDAVKAVAIAERRFAVLLRAMRVGSKTLQAVREGVQDGESRSKHTDKEIGLLRTAQAILEVRIEAEAEEARRCASGLFQRVETLRAHTRGGG